MSENAALKNTALMVLSSAITHDGSYLGGIPAEELSKALHLLEYHAILPVCYDVLSTAEIDRRDMDYVGAVCKRTALQSYRLLFLTRYYVDILKKAGIGVAVLKGISIGCDYPAFELRKSGDIDLYLTDGDDIKEAELVMCRGGARKSDEQHGGHHVAFVDGETGIEIELHTAFIGGTGSRAMDRAILEAEEQLSDEIADVRVLGDMELPMLPPHGQALQLLLHMLSHFTGTGFGLRLLLDWVYFWTGDGRKAAIAEYLRLVRDIGLTKFSDVVTAACTGSLSLDLEVAELLLSDEWVAKPKEERESMVDMFMDEVFASEEFGRSDGSRTVIPKRKGIVGLISQFHEQMKFNFKRASRIVILWPLLYIATFFIFLRNNRTIRHTSVSEVIRTAKKRREMFDELGVMPGGDRG